MVFSAPLPSTQKATQQIIVAVAVHLLGIVKQLLVINLHTQYTIVFRNSKQGPQAERER